MVSEAKVVLPPILSDNMVLQQKTKVNFWGTSEPGNKVTVVPSWNNFPVTAVTGDNGKWLVKLDTPEAGGPYDIQVSDRDSEVKVKNVLLGEVWLFSGQSNMGMMMKGFPAQPVEHSIDYIIAAKPDCPIRMCHVKGNLSDIPQEKYYASWNLHTPEAVSNTGATAYFTALTLQKALDVPVGIINAECGGSSIELWLDKATVEEYKEYFPDPYAAKLTRQDKVILEKKYHHYNSKIYPIENYTIKGLYWYQGESNLDNVDDYEVLFPAYVKMMREHWGQGEFPFYYVQIAAHEYGNPDGLLAARMRDVQMKALKTIPNSGMAVIIDDKPSSIHPPKKLEAGSRLAYLALEKTYHFPSIDAQGPIYKNMILDGNKAEIRFEAGPLGIQPLGVEILGFEIAGKDKVFYPAHAHIHMIKQAVIVYSDKVKEPVAVRYAFKNVPESGVFNISGIPASPFRTDDWDL